MLLLYWIFRDDQSHETLPQTSSAEQTVKFCKDVFKKRQSLYKYLLVRCYVGAKQYEDAVNVVDTTNTNEVLTFCFSIYIKVVRLIHGDN